MHLVLGLSVSVNTPLLGEGRVRDHTGALVEEALYGAPPKRRFVFLETVTGITERDHRGHAESARQLNRGEPLCVQKVAQAHVDGSSQPVALASHRPPVTVDRPARRWSSNRELTVGEREIPRAVHGEAISHLEPGRQPKARGLASPVPQRFGGHDLDVHTRASKLSEERCREHLMRRSTVRRIVADGKQLQTFRCSGRHVGWVRYRHKGVRSSRCGVLRTEAQAPRPRSESGIPGPC